MKKAHHCEFTIPNQLTHYMGAYNKCLHLMFDIFVYIFLYT